MPSGEGLDETERLPVSLETPLDTNELIGELVGELVTGELGAERAAGETKLGPGAESTEARSERSASLVHLEALCPNIATMKKYQTQRRRRTLMKPSC